MAVAPIALVAISAAASVAGGAIAFANSRTASKIAQRNATIATQQASAEETRLRREQKRRLASTRAQFSASGVKLAGSPLSVLGDVAMQEEEDAMLVRLGGQNRAAQFNLDAYGARQQGYGALIGGIGGAGQTLLTNRDLL